MYGEFESVCCIRFVDLEYTNMIKMLIKRCTTNN